MPSSKLCCALGMATLVVVALAIRWLASEPAETRPLLQTLLYSTQMLLMSGTPFIRPGELGLAWGFTRSSSVTSHRRVQPRRLQVYIDMEKLCALALHSASNTVATFGTLNKPRIAIITVIMAPKQHQFTTDRTQAQSTVVVENMSNKYKYAHHYDHDFLPIMWNFRDPSLPASWAKVAALIRYLPRYSWVWALDLDAFITNRNHTIEDHVLGNVPADKDFVISRDCNGLNGGSVLFRNTPRALEFLELVWSLRHNETMHNYVTWWEQSAYNYILKNNIKGMASIVHEIPQQTINAYKINCGHRWRVGDFVVHFPGVGNKGEAWSKIILEGGAQLAPLLP